MVVIMVIVIVVVIINVCVSGEDISSVGELSAGASQDVSASTDHVWCEGELLAVEDEEVSVFVKLGLVVSASILQVLNSILLVRDLAVVLVNVIVIVMDSVIVCRDV